MRPIVRHRGSFRFPVLMIAVLSYLAICATPSAGADPAQQSDSSTPPQIAGCSVFPADNIWNTPIDNLPVDPNSDAYVKTMGRNTPIQPDFDSREVSGEPFVVVSSSQPRVRVAFEYQAESDPAPYPIPPDVPIEGGPDATGDRHVLIVDKDRCVLYELYSAYPQPDGSWRAGSGAIFDLDSNWLRPAGWTSADAAGLPILPGLLRYDEVASGEIRHAIRFTARQTRKAYIWPARHYASSLTGSQYPPMGQRFRLRADYDLSGFAPEIQVILKAMQTYGIILGDNGLPWRICGVPDSRWDDHMLKQIERLKGSDFEAVDESSLMMNPDSGQVKGASTALASGPPEPAPPALASTSEFRLGFKLLADQIPAVVGVPLENEHFDLDSGDSLQRTTKGLMVWRKADNWTAFTDGSNSWVNGPYGVMERPNNKRFDWEAR